VRISPEVRYTRWGSGQQGAGEGLIRYNQNQADFLVGITF
jgi:outer membrane phospholipase A